MARREFSKPVYVEIVKRAMQPNGDIACEGCGLVLTGKKYHVDHTIPDALEIDKSRKLKAEDGKLLGVDCCHAPKTKADVKAIAKAKRNEAKHLKATTPKPKIPGRGFEKTDKPRKELAPLPRRQLYKEVGA